ncbi:hypothetical protein [Aeromicrobium stalagmiti]|uniref:hypothetical protein n=1 Tax=Aeromicrobium stalagmiti TaxID=2738988 RepID=UPI0015686098|nr:hypothetical protein [Aeromicrobium stalagmiti]NRQ51570.1 hypothetical protein [Aeromicrobium stalagmiti]
MSRPAAYSPWDDLARRTGVDLRWHNGKVAKWERPLGVTHFADLSVSLLVGRPEHSLRSTLTHELVHLDRGGFERSGGKERIEERRVQRAASQRLIDPVLYDLLIDYMNDSDAHFAVAGRILRRVLLVDWRMFQAYADWRKGVTLKTAMRKWEQFGPDCLPAWPAPWMASKANHLAIQHALDACEAARA